MKLKIYICDQFLHSYGCFLCPKKAEILKWRLISDQLPLHHNSILSEPETDNEEKNSEAGLSGGFIFSALKASVNVELMEADVADKRPLSLYIMWENLNFTSTKMEVRQRISFLFIFAI